MNGIKKFFKELRRTRWPKADEAWKLFLKSIIFCTTLSVILYLLSLGLGIMWENLGVGL